MGPVRTTPAHSITPPEREAALAAIARAAAVHEYVAIRPRCVAIDCHEQSIGVDIDPTEENLASELDRSIELGRTRFQRERIWEVIGADSFAADPENGDWPEGFNQYVFPEPFGEFALV